MTSRAARSTIAMAALAALALLAGVPAAAQGPGAEAAGGGAPELGLRVGEHPGFTRLVFDWAAPVGYRVEQRPGAAVLHFDRPARVDLSRFRADPPPRVLGVKPKRGADGLSVVLLLAESVTLRHFLSGAKVVVDVADRAAVQRVAAAEAATGGPAQSANPGAAPTRLTEAASPRRAERARRRGPMSITYQRVDLPDAAPIPGLMAARDRPLALRFRAEGPIAVAAFRLGPALWLVFDRPARADMAKKIAKAVPEWAPVEQTSRDGATVLRFTAPPDVAPTLRREPDGWTIDLRQRSARPRVTVKPAVRAGASGPELFLPAKGTGRLLDLPNPDLGDRLYVLPVTIPGFGLAEAWRYPEFEAPASYQGLVVIPRADTVRVDHDSEGLHVRAAGGGLALREGAKPVRRAEAPDPAGQRLFDLPAWRRGGLEDFDRNRRTLQGKLAKAASERALDLARIELARFYFAHGLAAEALSVLQLMTRQGRHLARDPELVLMRGASELLAGEHGAAAGTLSDPSLAGEWEAMPWRAALSAAGQDWAYAAELFDRAGPLIADYARPLRIRLRLLAAEARLGIADTGGASLYLEQVREDEPAGLERPQLDVLEARRLFLDDRPEMAASLWRKAAASSHPPSQARARLALVELGLKDGSLDQAAAVEELERLRFLWRGDDFEVALLERLSELYAATGDHRKALDTLRQAASHFPESRRAQAAGARMQDLFVGLFLGEAAAGLPPVRALALFEEFKELTPLGQTGNRLIESLVDHLVRVDLLTEAAAVLDEQVTQRLAGAERARAGARLALIRLLDQRPQPALDALAKTYAEGLPAELQDQRRHLKARSLASLGRGREALPLLSGDDSPDALSLRAEILWDLRDWTAAAAALARLAPAKPPAGRELEAAQRQTVVNLAIAHTLAGDRKALNDLKRRYGPAMAAGPDADSFALLTSDFDRADISAIADELAGVERIRVFMASYRDRIKQAGLSGVN